MVPSWRPAASPIDESYSPPGPRPQAGYLPPLALLAKSPFDPHFRSAYP